MPDAPMTEAALAEIEADTASVAGDEVLVGKETIAALISALRRSWAENADLKARLDRMTSEIHQIEAYYSAAEEADSI